MSFGICFIKKIAPRHSWRVCLIQRLKCALFLVSGLKDEKLIVKAKYTKTEARKLYSGVFGIFLPNVVKIDPYNFELYRFKICALFLRHSVVVFK